MTRYSAREYRAALTKKYLQEFGVAPEASAPSVSSGASPQREKSAPEQPAGPGILDYLPPQAKAGLDWLGGQVDPETRAPKSTTGWVLDLLSRPAYGMGHLLRDIKEDPLTGLGKAAMLPIPAANPELIQEMWTPKDRELPSDVLLENWDMEGAGLPEQAGRFAAGLALDIGLDPLTYVPGGVMKAGVSGALRGAGKLRPVAKVAEGMQAIKPQALDDTTRVYGDAERLVAEKAAGPVPRPPAPENSFNFGAEAVDNANVGAVNNSADAITPSGINTLDTNFPRNPRKGPPRNVPKYAHNRFAENLADGKHVAPTDAEAMAISRVLDSTGPSEVARVMRNVKTGETIPFSQRLANLSHARAKYGDLTFDDVPKPYVMETLPDTPVPGLTPTAEGSAARTATQEGTSAEVALTREEWQANPLNKIIISQVAGKSPKDPPTIITMNVRQASRYINDADPKKAMRAAEMLDLGYSQYLERFAAMQAKAAPTAKQAKAAARAQDVNRVAQKLPPGLELEAYKAFIRKHFDTQDAREILKYSRPEAVDAAIKKALSQRVRVKTFEILEVKPEPVNPFSASLLDTPNPGAKVTPKGPTAQVEKDVAEAQKGIDTASEQIERATPGEAIGPEKQAIAQGSEMDDVTREALKFALGPEGAQWAGRAPTFDHTSPIAKAFKNQPEINQGRAVTQPAFHGMAQSNFYRKVVAATRKEADAEGLKGLDSSRFMAPRVIKRLLDGEAALRANNIEPVLSRTATSGYPLGLGDILDVLYNGVKGRSGSSARSLVDRRIFSTRGITRAARKGEEKVMVRGTISTDSLVDAVRLVAEMVGPDMKNPASILPAIEAALKKGIDPALLDKALRTSTVNGLDNAILAGDLGVASANDAAIVVAEASKVLTDPKVMHALLQRIHDNVANSALQEIDTVRALSKETMTHFLDVLHSPATTAGEVAQTLGRLDDVAEAAVPTIGLPVTKEAVEGAAKAAGDAVPEVLKYSEVEQADAIRDVVVNIPKNNQPAIIGRTQQAYEDAVAAAMAELPTPYLMHADTVTDVAMNAGIRAKLAPFMEKAFSMFVNHYENATLHDSLVQGRTVSSLFNIVTRRELKKIQEAVDKGVISADDSLYAVRYLQGREHILTEAQEQAVKMWQPIIGQFFEHGKGVDSVFGYFFRNGFDPKHLADKFNADIYKIPEGLRFDLEKATVGKRLDRVKLAEQWKSWDITDPVDFFARVTSVATSLATDMSIAQEAWRISKSLGLASTVRHKGFVRIANPADSMIARYLPKDAWFDPRVLREIEKIDKILTYSDTLHGPFGRFISKYIDPTMNMWKSGMTVWNPGHHVRNLIGDSSLSFIADGVTNPKYAKRALAMLGRRRQYDGWDALAALQGVSRTPMKEGAVVATSRNGLKFTENEVVNGLMDRGSLPDFKHQEDLLESTGSPSIAALQEKMAIFGGRAKQTVGTISELRDDSVRLTHALHLLDHGSWDNVAEALDDVAARIRKTHPDGTDLTGFERKYMRRLFPFYSWTRKAIPLIAENMLIQPGRILVYPKVTYNWAQSQGIDLSSFSNPFPEDQMFPSYMTHRIDGPVTRGTGDGDYYSISPGWASNDVLNTFSPQPLPGGSGSEVLKGLLAGPISMLNPMIKGPAEILTGSSASTGASIPDLGEYMDSQIPGVTKLASLSGYSPTGTLWNLLPGGESGLDEQRSVAKGNRDHWSPSAFLNYLLGLGAQNMSTPSAITIAELEERDRLAREQRG